MGRVGVAGCGRMGLPMLRALCAGGVDAAGLDLRDVGDARVGTDAGAFGADLEILFTVVRDAEETEALLFGAQRLIARAPGLRLLALSSTLPPAFVHDLRAGLPDRIALVDAPMSGAAVAAEQARLSFILGGADADIEALMPHLALMGRHFHRMGGLGAGMTAKVLNNLLAAAHTATTRLALDWAAAAGLDEARFLNLVATSSGQNWFASGLDDIEFARDGWAADNTIGILGKDVDCALGAAPEGADTALPRAIRAAILSLKPRA